jgi:hypothetical protein
MTRAWWIWLCTTLLVGLYCAAAHVESALVETPIKVEAGFRSSMKIARLADNLLSMRLDFSESINYRSEPPTAYPEKPWPASSEKRYSRPSPALKLKVSAGSQSVIYEAEQGSVFRSLTSNLSIAPGVWRWPPPLDRPEIILHAGVTELSIEVLLVEAPLTGMSARLLVYPPLHWKKPNKDLEWVGILWLGQLWPLFALVQLVWAVLLLIVPPILNR